ncbi:acetoacetyl-CoA synthase [Halomonas sp. YLB-10]|uniref:type II toxin-antitoxin system CcdA family antitoxin n=1 Tax=Halomonas sp. YLB-10 TaxID=2483111 RepID=UPI000F5EE287|nr:type II toxin-antitoxin system CcdA family antitoxin [Halomonas sp. YLB-10]RQW71175.1 acetoacetyl-CoA synthase [Halomonas sp. YLB-10]
MRRRSDQRVLKKATNLSTNSDLSEKTARLKAKISATREKALEEKFAESEAEQWQRENSNAIKAYNDAVAEHGCFAEKYKTF